MLLADLKAMAGGMGIRGAGSMKKAQLVDAIKAAQAGGDGKPGRRQRPGRSEARRVHAGPRTRPAARREARGGGASPQRADDQAGEQGDPRADDKRGPVPAGPTPAAARPTRRRPGPGPSSKAASRTGQQDSGQPTAGPASRARQNQQSQRAATTARAAAGATAGVAVATATAPEAGGQRNEPDTTILEDDVLVPAAGILDVLDNYAFVRTSGYLPGPDDVYLSLSMVRRYGLRRGDAIVGQVRQPREGERREKFNPMVRIDRVNGADPEQARNRVEFDKLTPLYPSERLRLETEPTNLIGRVIDIARRSARASAASSCRPPRRARR